MTEDENKEFNLLQLADEMSHKNWMYFKFLYNKKFKEAEERIKELEAALDDVATHLPRAEWHYLKDETLITIGEKKDEAS
jgi:hypothetical protein